MMKVEIWSDIRCPFCYLGKRRFEAALEQFPHRDRVMVEWHSFQLDPYLVTQPDINVFDYLAERKGITREQSIQAHEQIILQARQLGLEYNFDRAVVANSFNAHRLTHLSKVYHLENVMEERLFRAYFTEGADISDIATLIKLGGEVGIPANAAQEMFNSDDYTDNVLQDQVYADELNIQGVPFFLFNGKISVRGAQSPETFLRALLKSWELFSLPVEESEKTKSYFFRKF